ncbi:hypothetical protein JCM10213_000022 [Rhodosporidiobolus nylandii]
MRVVFALLAAATAVSAAAVPHLERFALVRRADNSTSVFLSPTEDPFYKPQGAWEYKEPGAVLKSRKVSTALDQLSTAYQVLYRTTDAQDKPDATVATVFKPLQPAQGEAKVLLFMTPADTAAEDCQTSYALLSSTQSNVTVSSVSIDLLVALSKGYQVVVPDHEGSKAAFISGKTEAQAGLDGLRAFLNYEKLHSYKAVIKGYSGGGHAAAWATQCLSTYGKGLSVIASVAGGVPAELYATTDQLSGTANANLAVAAFAGLANAEPELQSWLEANMYTNGTDALAYVRSNAQCIDSTVSAGDPLKNIDIYSLFKGGEAAMHEGVPKRIVDQEKLGTVRPAKPTGPEDGPKAGPGGPSDKKKGVLPVPTFLFHSKTDEVVSYAPIRPYYLDQCKKGANIHLSTVSGSTHVETYLTYLADAYTFLDKAFTGSHLEGCSSSNGPALPLLSAGYLQAIGPVAAQQLTALVSGASTGARMRL